MSDDPKQIKLSASGALGIKEPLKAPKHLTKRVVRLTPNGTETALESTKEALDYYAALERDKIARANVPRAPKPGQYDEIKFKRDLMSSYAKRKDKDKGDDFER